MSVRATVRALPTLLRIGFSEAIAYRAEMIVWVLSTTMPFINLALWLALAREGVVVSDGGRQFTPAHLTAYFLAMFIVRQLTGAWAAWEMNFEVRSGKLSMRLLRPVHPLWSYAVENVAAMPLRLVVALPVVLVILVAVGPSGLPQSFVQGGLVLIGFIGGWLITLFVNLAVGCLALFMESSLKLMDVYLTIFFVFSGYIVPVELFPAVIRDVAAALPFRYQIGVPTELFIGAYTPAQALPLLGMQWLWVAILCGITSLLWRTGLKRFAAYGG
jgi:ABC-2 type transport system permease protein